MSDREAIARVMDLRGTYKGGGGPDKTILHSAARHDPGRVQVLVTYLRQPWDHEFRIAQMARALGINYVDVVDRSLIDLACLRRLRALIKEHSLQLVHAHDDKTLLYGWLLRLATPGLKIMYTCHSHAVYGRCDFSSLIGYLSFKARQRIQISLMRRFSKPVIAVSRETAQRLVRNGLGEDETAVLHNGIDSELWRPAKGRPVLREELRLPAGALLVGTVARITYDKDLPTFFAVARLVAEKVPGTVFVVVGDGYGDELQRAREEVHRLGLGEVVRFTGHREDLRDVYLSLDVFLMTSLTEGLPNTLLEAMAMGVPAVATSVGGVPELLEDGRGGFLCPAGDAAALAGRVLLLLEDRSLRESCARQCRERIESRFSFDRRVSAMEEYYRSFCAGQATPRSSGDAVGEAASG